LALELADGAGDRWLADALCAGGGGDTPGVCNSGEEAKEVKIE
jgi:hypothetical protein